MLSQDDPGIVSSPDRAFQDRAIQIGSQEVRPSQMGIPKVRPFQMGSQEVRPFQMGSLEVGITQITRDLSELRMV